MAAGGATAKVGGGPAGSKSRRPPVLIITSRAASLRAGRPRFGAGFQRRLLWLPLKPHASFWRLRIFAGWPGRTPFSRAENPPIAFIRELKKQVRIGLVLRGEGQSAISDRAGAAHGISNPNATERGFKYRKKDLVRGRPLARCAIEGMPGTLLARKSRTHQRPSQTRAGLSRARGFGSASQA